MSQISPDIARAAFTIIDVSSLDSDQVRALYLDTQALAEEDFGEDNIEDESFTLAERELLSRIGGQSALAGYVACLMVDWARAQRIEARLIARGFDQSNGARVSCSQCEALAINGTACHERGCPNIVPTCRECGSLDPDRVCCTPEEDGYADALADAQEGNE